MNDTWQSVEINIPLEKTLNETLKMLLQIIFNAL